MTLEFPDALAERLLIAQAESDTADSADATALPAVTERRYLVELIVFDNVGAISDGGELWHRKPVLQFEPDLLKPQPELSVPADETTSPDEAEEDPIQPAELGELEPLLAKLRANPRYEVVTHIAWTQPLKGQRDSDPVDLRQAALNMPAVDGVYANPSISTTGNIHVYENTLLYVDLDFTNEYITEAVDYSVGSQPTRPAGAYQLREKRRVKLNEIHYFDHPFFGALVRVSRVEPGQVSVE